MVVWTSFIAGIIQTLLYADFIYYFVKANQQERILNFPVWAHVYTSCRLYLLFNKYYHYDLFILDTSRKGFIYSILPTFLVNYCFYITVGWYLIGMRTQQM